MKKIIIGVIVVILAVVIGYQAALMKVVKSENNTEEGGMSHTMDGMTAELAGLSGDKLDKAFLELMIVHHEGAIVMAEQVLAETKRPELQEMAKTIIAAQQREIEMMGSWLDAWFKSDDTNMGDGMAHTEEHIHD